MLAILPIINWEKNWEKINQLIWINGDDSYLGNIMGRTSPKKSMEKSSLKNGEEGWVFTRPGKRLDNELERSTILNG